MSMSIGKYSLENCLVISIKAECLSYDPTISFLGINPAGCLHSCTISNTQICT